MIKSCKKPPVYFPTVTGAICSFNSQYADLPLKSHTVDIDYTGNAISGVNVAILGDDTNLLYYEGIFSGDYYMVNLGTLNWVKTSNFFRAETTLPLIQGTDSIISKDYTLGNPYAVPNDKIYLPFVQSNAQQIIIIRDLEYSDANIFKNAMNGEYLVYKLQTPITPIININDYNSMLSAFNSTGEAYGITFDTPIYGGSYDCLTGVVTSNKDSGGGDITPTYQQTATANCETNLGVNNIFADTGNTTLEYLKAGR